MSKADITQSDRSDEISVVLDSCAKAKGIVTENLKHFPASALELWNVKSMSSERFLCHLYNLDPKIIIQVIQRQASGLKKPPMTVEQLLNLLNREVPDFVAKISADLK
jgi:hypothetical protein